MALPELYVDLLINFGWNYLLNSKIFDSKFQAQFGRTKLKLRGTH